LIVFLGLTFPPFLFSKYKGFPWRRKYERLLPVLFFFFSFFIAHSLSPHKEERFMIPVLPLFFILVTPLVEFVLAGSGRRWRLGYFVPLNLVLLFFTSFNTAQRNIVGLCLYLDQHESIKKVIGVEDTLVLFPSAFITRSIKHVGITVGELEKHQYSCQDAIAVRKDVREAHPEIESKFTKVTEFTPGILEHLLVKINPKRNGRRGPIELYANPECLMKS
jgi:hypothetical protein